MDLNFGMQNLLLSCLLMFITPTQGFLNATENAKALVIANDRLYASVNRSTGIMDVLTLDGQNLLGTKEFNEVTPGGNAAGQNGIGPYLDCIVCLLARIHLESTRRSSCSQTTIQPVCRMVASSCRRCIL